MSRDNNFENFFFRKELLQISGRGMKVFFLLCGLLLLSYLALNIGITSYSLLKDRMDDPFTNWVELPIGSQMKQTRDAIRNDFAQGNDSFFIEGVDFYSRFYLDFAKNRSNSSIDFKGLTIEPESDLFKEVINKSATHINRDIEFPCAIVVTEKLLIQLQYDPDRPPAYLVQYFDDIPLVIPIYAVVEKLPKNTDWAMPPSFFRVLTLDLEGSGFVLLSNKQFKFSVISPLEGDSLQQLLEEKYRLQVNKVEKTTDGFTNEFYTVILEFASGRTTASFIKTINQTIDPNVFAYAPSNCVEAYSDSDDQFYLAFQFSKLERIRDFQDFVEQKYKVELNMEQVIMKENFAVVANFALFLIFMLIFFSCISIIFFLMNVANNHIDKISKTLGTLKANGVSNAFLMRVYLKAFGALLAAAYAVTILASILVFLLDSFFLRTEMISLFSWEASVILLSIGVVNLLVIWKTIEKKLKKSPGDLVYGR